MSEQSRALLEHSKAKHQAMVAQAHAAKSQPTLNFVSLPREPLRAVAVEEEESGAPKAPKPPIKPSSVRKPTSSHRMARYVHHICYHSNSH
jgi:hypothetical protein